MCNTYSITRALSTSCNKTLEGNAKKKQERKNKLAQVNFIHSRQLATVKLTTRKVTKPVLKQLHCNVLNLLQRI